MYEQETEELRKQIRMRDSLSKADPELLGLAAGLCIKCATNEAIIQPTGGIGQSVITLTRSVLYIYIYIHIYIYIYIYMIIIYLFHFVY